MKAITTHPKTQPNLPTSSPVYLPLKIHKNASTTDVLTWYPQQESNLHLPLRRGSFYPLNYEGLFKLILTRKKISQNHPRVNYLYTTFLKISSFKISQKLIFKIIVSHETLSLNQVSIKVKGLAKLMRYLSDLNNSKIDNIF